MESESSKSGLFPEGLRVLVVDHDLATLKNLEKLLLKCKYRVTTCSRAQEAADMIEKRKDGFDIVMSEASVPDMDGFLFLEQVGRLDANLPVIMMSTDRETSRAMKWVQHGACGRLLKPIGLKVLRNIWQHVAKKRKLELENVEDGGTDESNDSCRGTVAVKKRKENEYADPSSVKKTRLNWTPELHQKFLDAVDQISVEKAAPKKILELMAVPDVTRENVASHLQKYRKFLARMNRDHEIKAAYGERNLLVSQNMFLQSGVNPNFPTLQQNMVTNESYLPRGHELRIHGHSACLCEGNVAEIAPMERGNSVVFGDFGDDSMSYSQQFEQLDLAMKSESEFLTHNTWSGGASSSQFSQHFQSECRYDHFPLVAPYAASSSREADPNRHFYSSNRSYDIGTESTTALNSTPQESLMPYHHAFEPVEQNSLEYSLENMVLGIESVTALRPCDPQLNGFSSAADGVYIQNPHLANIESFSCNHEDLFADSPPNVHESQNNECGSNQGKDVTNRGPYFLCSSPFIGTYVYGLFHIITSEFS